MKQVLADKKKIPAIQDISPSNEYGTLPLLLGDATRRGWTDSKTGRIMLRHFGHLINTAKRTQDSECDVCDETIDDTRNVAVRHAYIVHSACQTWPKGIGEAVKRSLKAYDR